MVNPARMLRQEKFLGQIKEAYAEDILIPNAHSLEEINVFVKPDKHMLAVKKNSRVYQRRWLKLPEDTAQSRSVME